LYHNFIGIDISKADFHVGLHGSKETKSFDNIKSGFSQFFKTYKKELSNGLVVLETNGGYETLLIEFLQHKKIAVHRANTRIVKNFIRSTGKLGKSDRIDALGLARYAFERHESLTLYQAPSAQQKELLQLSRRKKELKSMLVQEKNRMQAPDNQFIKISCEQVIQSLTDNIKQIETRIKELIQTEKHMQQKVELLSKEIKGVGEITAIDLLINIPELGSLDRRKIASLSGTAPHPYESGKKIGYRSTRGGRQTVKPILYMAAMAASRSLGELGKFYKSLVSRGKKPIVALVALMRKMIVIANAKIRDFEQSLILV
jgi:transposase